MTAKYGNRKVPKMIREWRALADLCRQEGTPAIQDALDKVEQHIDYAYGAKAEGGDDTHRDLGKRPKILTIL